MFLPTVRVLKIQNTKYTINDKSDECTKADNVLSITLAG